MCKLNKVWSETYVYLSYLEPTLAPNLVPRNGTLKRYTCMVGTKLFCRKRTQAETPDQNFRQTNLLGKNDPAYTMKPQTSIINPYYHVPIPLHISTTVSSAHHNTSSLEPDVEIMPEFSPNGTLPTGTATSGCCPPENQRLIIPTPTFRKLMIGARKRGTTGSRGSGFGQVEIDRIGLIDRFIPLCKEEWDAVMVDHEKSFPQTSRTVDSLRRKFASIHRRKIPTGDPLIPADVKRAKKIRYRSTEKADLVLMDDQGAESLPTSDGLLSDGDEVEDSSEDVASVSPAVKNEPTDATDNFTVTTEANATSAAFSPELQAGTAPINL